MRKEYNLLIGDSTAEKIKKEMGTAIATGTNTYPVKGRDLRSGTPKIINLAVPITNIRRFMTSDFFIKKFFLIIFLNFDFFF
jgi:actin-like ATPase involved in cell morphogenesis